METMTFTNSKGQSVALGNDAPFVLVKTEGTGEVRTDIQSQKSPQQDGVSYLDNTLEPRVLSAEIMILGNGINEIARYRKKLTQVFNPKLGPGQLTYQLGDVEREIEAISELSPVFPNAGDFKDCMQPGLIQLFCSSPFWLDTYFEDQEMSYVSGGIKFGLILPTAFSHRGYKRYAVNEGDVLTPVTIEFRGPATNPAINNLTTRESIIVNRELRENDVLTISTAFGQKYVKINDENAFHYIDLDSVFWGLVPGENILSYESNNDSIKTRVMVKWRNRYVGL